MSYLSEYSTTGLYTVRDLTGFAVFRLLLQRNDCKIDRVSTAQIPRTILRGSGVQPFYLALKDNTVVKVLDIHLPGSFYTSTWPFVFDAAAFQACLHFIEHNPSLTTVVLLYSEKPWLSVAPVDLVQVQQAVLDAIALNPSIRSVDMKYPTPLNVLTQFVSTDQGQRLERLAVQLDDDDASHEVIQAAALSIASHPTLQEIGFSTTSTRAATALSPFLSALQLPSSSTHHSNNKLRRLDLQWEHLTVNTTTPDLSVLPAGFGASQKLCEVSLSYLDVDGTTWTMIADGLTASPSITRLKLHRLHFLDDDAYGRFFANAPTSNPLQRHIQKLSLSQLFMNVRMNNVEEHLPHLLRFSQVRDLKLDRYVVKDYMLGYFFDKFQGAGSSSLPACLLRSLELCIMQLNVLESMAESVYLQTTVHLCRLKIGLLLPGPPYKREPQVPPPPQVVPPVPRAFLSSLKGNGSLRSVRIHWEDGDGLVYRPVKRVQRYIRACTKRNKALPKVLPTLFQTNTSDHAVGGAVVPNIDAVTDSSNYGNAGSTPNNPKSKRFPTLCQSAMQAPQMAPNNVLIGLLAASVQVVGQDQEETRDEKRASSSTV